MNRKRLTRLLTCSKGTLLAALLVVLALLAGAPACGQAVPEPTATPLRATASVATPGPTATAVPLLPDLVVTVRGPDSAEPGQALGNNITVEVSNKGYATARNFSVSLYVSTDKTVDQRDTLLLGGREFVQSLEPGETVAVKLGGSNRLPEDLPQGARYLGVVVDETDAVEELDEDNNTASWPIAIRVALAPSPTPTSRPVHTSTVTASPTTPSPTPAKPARTSTPTAAVSPSPSPTVAKTPTLVVIKTPTVKPPTPMAFRTVSSAPLSGSQAAGLAWGAGWFWVSDAVERQVYAVDPHSGKVLSSMSIEASSPRGLAWDGGSLWVADQGGERLLYQLVPEKGGLTINVVPAPGKNSAPCGLTYGDQSLWVSHGCAKGDETDMIYQIDPGDGTVIKSFPSPGSQPEGLAFGHGVLWNVDGATGVIYVIDPYSGVVLGSGAVPGMRGQGSLVGLAFDGSYLWANDALYLYQVKP